MTDILLWSFCSFPLPSLLKVSVEKVVPLVVLGAFGLAELFDFPDLRGKLSASVSAGMFSRNIGAAKRLFFFAAQLGGVRSFFPFKTPPFLLLLFLSPCQLSAVGRKAYRRRSDHPSLLATPSTSLHPLTIW